ncbi:MAG: hypothetical protein IKO72_15550 [Kiritimatiellae bacterium]|nr:hypothetical protein [Kiritimatiellia bacterium]
MLPRILSFVTVVSLCLSASGQSVVPNPATNVVAVVIGYENTVQLPSKELIRTFPTSLPSNSETNCRAVLFSILSPSEWKGRYFLLQRSGCQCQYCRTRPMPQIFSFGEKYSFGSITNISHMLFDIGLPRDVKVLSFPRDGGHKIVKPDPKGPTTDTDVMIDSINMDKVEHEYCIKPQRSWQRPLSEAWNPDIISLKNTYFPPMTCRDMTLTEILECIEKACLVNYEVEIRQGPSDATWKRKYNLAIGGNSVLDTLLKIGELQDVSLYVDLTRRSSAIFTYRVPLDLQFIDWSNSVYSRTIPSMTFHDVSVKDLTFELFKKTMKEWYDSGKISEATFGFGIKNKNVLEKRLSFSFDGINLRDAIFEICTAYGVRYDFRRHSWEEKLQ